ALQHDVRLARAAAGLEALGVFGDDEGARTTGDAAGLPDPGEDDDALVGQKIRQCLADRLGLPAQALIVGRDQTGHQADIGFRQFAACVWERIQADIQRAFAHRRELRVGLDQRGIRIDLCSDFAAAALGYFCSENPAEAVAEIALVDSSAGKLVRYFQCGCGPGRPGPKTQNGGRGKRCYEDVTACEHGYLRKAILNWNVRADVAAY